jgi:hypothetical protein
MNGNSAVNFTQTAFFAAETGVCFSDKYAKPEIVSMLKSIPLSLIQSLEILYYLLCSRIPEDVRCKECNKSMCL